MAHKIYGYEYLHFFSSTWVHELTVNPPAYVTGLLILALPLHVVQSQTGPSTFNIYPLS